MIIEYIFLGKEQAKQQATEPLTAEGEPATEGQVFYLINPIKDLFHKAGARVNHIEEMNKLGISLDRRIISIDT